LIYCIPRSLHRYKSGSWSLFGWGLSNLPSFFKGNSGLAGCS
jgi:hypothetical protein